MADPIGGKFMEVLMMFGTSLLFFLIRLVLGAKWNECRTVAPRHLKTNCSEPSTII